jgi:hypothetical protein
MRLGDLILFGMALFALSMRGYKLFRAIRAKSADRIKMELFMFGLVIVVLILVVWLTR